MDYDYVDDDSNPFPVGESSDHGTYCAGAIAMVKSNGFCGVGVAYQSTITGMYVLSEYFDLKHSCAMGL